MHHVALFKVLVLLISLIAAKLLNVLIQIPAHVFIHDRKKKEELLIYILLLDNRDKITESVRLLKCCRFDFKVTSHRI